MCVCDRERVSVCAPTPAKRKMLSLSPSSSGGRYHILFVLASKWEPKDLLSVLQPKLGIFKVKHGIQHFTKSPYYKQTLHKGSVTHCNVAICTTNVSVYSCFLADVT